MSHHPLERTTPPNDRDWYSPADLLPAQAEARFSVQAAAAPAPPHATATWAADAQSADYHHLGEAISTQPFSLTAAHLADLCVANRFSPDGGQDEVLFGLRGCKLAPGTGNDFADSVSLQEDVPDHFDFHCVIGVWKRSTGRLAVFRASTVPNRRFMALQKQSPDSQTCNMLPTGRYIYTVGVHHGTIRGVFVQQSGVIVQRSNDNLTYETTDFYEIHDPADNIHPSFSDSDAKFSSAGCNTIPGTWTAEGGHQGSWATFRNRAGLSDSSESHMGDKFVYVLLTGREARLAATGQDMTPLARLRFGSSSDEVTGLQQNLQAGGFNPHSIDGSMGPGTTLALIHREQAQNNGAADGISTVPPG